MDKDLEARVDAYVDEVWDSVLADIAKLVTVPSVAIEGADEPGAPFGKDSRAALDCALEIAAKLGYETSHDDGYMGMADIPGESERQIATIAHVDVVPAGPGWNTDPFTMEHRDGWLLGRGVIDDKGPAVLGLYAGAYLLHEGIKPRYTFRALLGTDEETGMNDVGHYLAGHEDPAFLFTPDAEFPVCNAEKGQFGATFITEELGEDARILLWSGAEATNAIPSQSICEVAVDASALPAPASHADRLQIEAVEPGRARITAHGIGGHASMPEGTLNAIKLVLDYLREAGVCTGAEARVLELLSVIHADTAGEALGIAAENEAFGPLTCNGGTIEVKDGRIQQTIDVRLPNCVDLGELEATCRAVAERFGAELAVDHAVEAFYTPADSPAVSALIDVYNEVTGENATPFAMGGGTYARRFARAVSFGPEVHGLELPEWGGPMHGPNEVASEALLRQALKIYILAILRLNNLSL